jgi:hypothetical protein
MGNMQQDDQDFDVSTLEGVTAFVEHIAEETGRTLFQTKGLMPTCTLFALKDPEGRNLATATPLLVPPLTQDWKEMRRTLRLGYLRFDARGVLRVHSEGRRVLFQVEHSEFGDLVWYATPDDHGMLGKLIGPTSLEKLEFPKLNVLPRTYMS